MNFSQMDINGAKDLSPFGGFRFVIGVPPVIIHFNEMFPNKNHPAIGEPPLTETPISSKFQTCRPGDPPALPSRASQCLSTA